MTLSQLQSAQATAGARYAAAVTELRAAYVDLAALDAAISNANVGGRAQRTFTGIPEKLPIDHPVYAPPAPAARLPDQIAAARDTYVSGFTPG